MSARRPVDASEADFSERRAEPTPGLERRAHTARARSLFEAQDFEQEQLARLAHDTLAQSLNAARIYARVSRTALERACPEALEQLGALEKAVQAAADDLGVLTRWLQPAQSKGGGLTATLAELCALTARTVPCALCTPHDISAKAELETELLRIAQLALHALAQSRSLAGLEVEVGVQELSVTLQIRASELHGASELPLPGPVRAALDERARTMGGSCTVHGATLTCTLSLQ